MLIKIRDCERACCQRRFDCYWFFRKQNQGSSCVPDRTMIRPTVRVVQFVAALLGDITVHHTLLLGLISAREMTLARLKRPCDSPRCDRTLTVLGQSGQLAFSPTVSATDESFQRTIDAPCDQYGSRQRRS
jgi:hypothetical protein